MSLQQAEKGLSAFGRFFTWIKNNDTKGYEERIAAVSAVLAASVKTRQYIAMLKEKKRVSPATKNKWEQELSELWAIASKQVGRFNKKLGHECLIKAYGWGTGVWDDKAFDVVPRRVEEVYSEALELLRNYTAVLTEDVVH